MNQLIGTCFVGDHYWTSFFYLPCCKAFLAAISCHLKVEELHRFTCVTRARFLRPLFYFLFFLTTSFPRCPERERENKTWSCRLKLEIVNELLLPLTFDDHLSFFLFLFLLPFSEEPSVPLMKQHPFKHLCWVGTGHVVELSQLPPALSSVRGVVAS